MKAALLALLLAGCSNTFQTRGDAVGYCMVLGQVPVRVGERVECTGTSTYRKEEPALGLR